MIRFLIDEDMPRSAATALKNVGFECYDVREIGLRGADDKVIYGWAQKENCVILTEDLGFSNTLRFPLGSHKGIVIVRFPGEMSTETMNKILKDTLLPIQEELANNLTIIEPAKTRIRRGT
jgi:predicted nuclease of predicted toxin-antitoxin system